jgi:septal ring factor EnvC (AmiA/AmiB activator)
VDHLRSENEELENGLRLSAEEIERLQKRIMYLDARRDELKEQVRRREMVVVVVVVVVVMMLMLMLTNTTTTTTVVVVVWWWGHPHSKQPE